MTEFLIVVCIVWLVGLTLVVRGMLEHTYQLEKNTLLCLDVIEKLSKRQDIHKEQIDLSHNTLKVVYKILSDMKGVALKQPEA